MNGNDANGTKWAMQVIVEFNQDLFRHAGVKHWNDVGGELVRRGLVPVAWSRGERPSPIGIMIDFSGLQARHCRLDGLDFTFCDISGSDFEGSSMKGAKVGDAPRGNLRATHLQGAAFRGDVSGADFTDACLEGADFSDAYHYEGEPPIGLPPETLAAIESVREESGDGGADEPFMQPLTVRATIHEVPW